MKKIIFLFVLAFELISADSSNSISEGTNDFLACCTATSTYNGNLVHSITKCSGMSGSQGEYAASHEVSSAVRDCIKGAQYTLDQLENLF